MVTDPAAAGRGAKTVAQTGDPLLVCTGLHYSYLDRFPALNGVDLTVARGEKRPCSARTAPAKSTTLLKVLNGLVFPTAGMFTAFGEPITEDTLEDEQALHR